MKLILKIGIKLSALLIPFFVICPIAVRYMPMRFLDYEYSSYLQNQEWVNGKGRETYARILVMGDSTAKASWLPEELSEDTYNYALAGSSPIESYYYLEEYLEKNPAPEYLFYMQGIGLFYIPHFFWSRSVYFHRLDQKYLKDLAGELEAFEGDTGYLQKDNFQRECFLYETYSPSKYFVAFLKGLVSSERYHKNMERYSEVIETKGQTQFGTAKRCDDAGTDAERVEFEPDNIIDRYFRKLIELCEENGIQFIFRTAPLNVSTYENMKERVLEDYSSYLESIQTAYPGAWIETKLYGMDNKYFGDTMHLNYNGTLNFCAVVKQEYPDIFVTKG